MKRKDANSYAAMVACSRSLHGPSSPVGETNLIHTELVVSTWAESKLMHGELVSTAMKRRSLSWVGGAVRTDLEPSLYHRRIFAMLYMIVETFRSGAPDEVGTRFKTQGRLVPESAGLSYVASWMATDGTRCYQLMEAANRAAFDGWIANWSDLADFEISEVKISAEYWSSR